MEESETMAGNDESRAWVKTSSTRIAEITRAMASLIVDLERERTRFAVYLENGPGPFKCADCGEDVALEYAAFSRDAAGELFIAHPRCHAEFAEEAHRP